MSLNQSTLAGSGNGRASQPRDWVWKPPAKTPALPAETDSPLPNWLDDIEPQVEDESAPLPKDASPNYIEHLAQWTEVKMPADSIQALPITQETTKPNEKPAISVSDLPGHDLGPQYIGLLRYYATTSAKPSTCVELFDCIMEDVKQGSVSDIFADHLVQEMFDTARNIRYVRQSERHCLLEKIVALFCRQDLPRINKSIAPTRERLIRHICIQPRSLDTDALLRKILRLVTTLRDGDENLARCRQVLLIRVLSNPRTTASAFYGYKVDWRAAFRTLVETMDPKLCDAWLQATLRHFSQSDVTENEAIVKPLNFDPIEIVALLVGLLNKFRRAPYGPLNKAGSTHERQWNAVYKFISMGRDPEHLVGHFARLSRQDQLIIVLRHWFSKHISAQSLKQHATSRIPDFTQVETHVATTLKSIENRYNTRLAQSPEISSSRPLQLIVLMKVILRHGQDPRPFLDYILPLDMKLEQPQAFAEQVVALRRSKHFRSLPSQTLAQFIAYYKERAPLAALQVSNTLNDFSISDHPELALTLLKYTDAPDAWLRNLVDMPDRHAGDSEKNLEGDNKKRITLFAPRRKLLHALSVAFAQSLRYSPRAAFKNIVHLYRQLREHDATIMPDLSQALTYAFIVRSLRRRDRLNMTIVRRVLKIVAYVEGRETAEKLDLLVLQYQKAFLFDRDGTVLGAQARDRVERQRHAQQPASPLTEMVDFESPSHVLRRKGGPGIASEASQSRIQVRDGLARRVKFQARHAVALLDGSRVKDAVESPSSDEHPFESAET